MGIIYLISVILLCAGFIIIKKSEKEIDLISFIGITIVVLLAYNAFICYVINFIQIPTTLLNLSIINLIFAGIMFGIIIKKKEKQKYKIDKFGIIAVIVILFAVLLVSYFNFGLPFNIKYETGDPAVHYMTSRLFAEEDSLLNLYKSDIYGSFEGRKIGSYVNSGIIMQCFEGITDSISNYKIFIGFGIFILFVTGTVMYSTLEKFTKTRKGQILALIVSLIYVMGYPLNSLLFGFEYLSLGILVLGAIVHMIHYFEKEELSFPFYVIIFALLNFAVFCSYYMFVPFTYSALWIYFCIYSKKKNGKIFCKRNITMLGVTLLIPFFLGYIYHLAPTIYNILNIDAYNNLKNSLDFSSNVLNNSFKLYGYIYVNYYSNALIFIPLVIYYIYQKKKEKKLLSFDTIFLVCLLLFIGLLALGVKFEKVSEYFLMKNYYALWLVLIYINFKALMYIFEENKATVYSLLGFYIVLIVLNMLFADAPLGKGPGNPNENISNLVEIFGVNKTIIKTREIDYNLDEIEILEYVKENLDLSNDKIEFLADSEQIFWEYGMLDYINYDTFFEEPSYSGQDKLTLKAMYAYQKIGRVDYIVYFNRSFYYNELDEKKFLESGQIVFENEAGGIIRYEI